MSASSSFAALRPVLSALLALGGALGVIAHLSSLYTAAVPASLPAQDAFIALLVCVAALESLYAPCGGAQRCAPAARGRAAALCRTFAPRVSACAAFVAAVLFAVGYRLDTAAWSLCLALAFLLGGVGAAAATADVGAEPQKAHAYSPLAGPLNSPDASVSALDAEPEDAAPPTARCADARSCCCAPGDASLPRRALFYAHGLVWGALLVCATLLVGGSGTIAVGWRRFTPRGSFYTIPVRGAAVRMHAFCAGPTPNAKPTIFIDCGGGGHSSSDVYGLVDALAAAGRRVCTADPPGTGWTRLGALEVRVDTVASWSLDVLSALGETPPFVLVGTMDDAAERIYLSALQSPSSVSALVPMQYAPPEMALYAAFKGLDEAGATPYALSQIRSRRSLCDVIRSLGVAWGLVSAVIPSSPSRAYVGDFAAKNFLNLLHEGQWDMQCRYLSAQIAAPTTLFTPSLWASNRSLQSTVPVFALANSPADPCAGGLAGDACALQRFAVRAARDFMRNMSTMTPRSSFEDCSGACDGWLGDGFVSNVAWVTARILAAA
jgi:hypothetical protein